jgi:hypothetical protein
MGVTTGGLFNNEFQIVTIEIPRAPDATLSAALAAQLQAVIDSFNNDFGAGALEVL